MEKTLKDFIYEESKKGHIYYKFYKNYGSSHLAKLVCSPLPSQLHIYLIRGSENYNSKTYNAFEEDSLRSLIFTSRSPIIEVRMQSCNANIRIGLHRTPLKYTNFSFIEGLVKRLVRIYFINTYPVC